MGAINLIDVDQQRQVATYGTVASDAPREESYCDITIGEDRPVVVSDTLLDPRFAGRAFTTGVLGKLRSYAGAQLTTPEGHHLGALCVFDEQPWEVMALQVEALELLWRSRTPPSGRRWSDWTVASCRSTRRWRDSSVGTSRRSKA